MSICEGVESKALMLPSYERYLNLEDEEVFSHLHSLRPKVEHLTDFVQRLVLCQLRG